LQNKRADLRGRIFLAAALDPRVAIVARNDLVRDKIHVLLHHRIGEAATDQAFDRKKSVLGVGYRLTFRRLADEALARFGECNHRGRCADTLAILDHLGILAFHHGNAGIRRAEIDTDDLAHVHLVLKQDRAARGSTVPIPREMITAIPSLWLGSIYVSGRAATTTLAVAHEPKIHRFKRVPTASGRPWRRRPSPAATGGHEAHSRAAILRQPSRSAGPADRSRRSPGGNCGRNIRPSDRCA